MCVSMDQAEFSGTILYAGRCRHPRHGLIDVLGYQNTAVNLAAGANAMLLHLPALDLTPDNFIAVGRHDDVLTRMVDAVRRSRPAGRSQATAWMGAEDEPAVQVFEHDIYTVLLATDPTAIPAALGRVPAHKRPRLNPDLMAFYADHYPGHTVMVCCFDNAEALRAKPLLVWYRSWDRDRLVAPALDCHTGEPPNLDEKVATDHWMLFGTDDAPPEWGAEVSYPDDMRHKLRDFLPRTVTGLRLRTSMPNGDFAIAHDDLLARDLTRIERLQPTR